MEKQGSKTGSTAGRTVPTATTKQVLSKASTGTARGTGVPARWAWHCRVLLHLRDRLLREQGHRLESAQAPIEPHSMELADSATDEFDRDMALSAVSASGDALYEVTEALGRIRDGSYGICQETAQPIPAARLKAVPWARFTREVEERLEITGQVSQARLDQAQSLRGPPPGGLADTVPGSGDEATDEETAAAADESLSPHQPPRFSDRHAGGKPPRGAKP